MYNYTALTDGTNFVEWSIIINSWTGGILFSGIIIIGSIITFSIIQNNNRPSTVALMTSSFIWGIIAALLWVIQWNDYILVPTVLPILYSVTLGVSAFIHIIKNGIGNV